MSSFTPISCVVCVWVTPSHVNTQSSGKSTISMFNVAKVTDTTRPLIRSHQWLTDGFITAAQVQTRLVLLHFSLVCILQNIFYRIYSTEYILRSHRHMKHLNWATNAERLETKLWRVCRLFPSQRTSGWCLAGRQPHREHLKLRQPETEWRELLI